MGWTGRLAKLSVILTLVMGLGGCQSANQTGRNQGVEAFDTGSLVPGNLPALQFELGIEIREPMEVSEILSLGFEKSPASEHFLWEEESPESELKEILTEGDEFYVKKLAAPDLTGFLDVYIIYRDGVIKSVEFFALLTDENEYNQMKEITSWLFKNRLWNAFNYYKRRKPGQKGYEADLAELNATYENGIGKRIIQEYPSDGTLRAFYSYQPGLDYSVSNSGI
ncbi:hypothetical protein [Aestuariispira insulae]|uniref:Lipoprotein n=1 Tax=Aestuariispira insulae TaxID=1461337 RepID=A0A3D9HI20_9PROT|nr:hypothetical protein [Aestuariispira insulae]RED48606.1 hypothetical protein DFP90_107110 [Aestuariispira insulae]